MSAFGKQGTRCDTCGKFSKNPMTGEYIRKDQTTGYIWPECGNKIGVAQENGRDICDDCLETIT